jgi:hypothetical protein
MREVWPVAGGSGQCAKIEIGKSRREERRWLSILTPTRKSRSVEPRAGTLRKHTCGRLKAAAKKQPGRGEPPRSEINGR